MKRTSCLLLTVLLLLTTLCACGSRDAFGAKVYIADSLLYKESDIDGAIKVVEKYFAQNFDDCTLLTMEYDGDPEDGTLEEWAKTYGADEAIVLTSDFKTGKGGGDGSLEPNTVYKDWQWILVRNKGGQWIHKSHGYS